MPESRSCPPPPFRSRRPPRALARLACALLGVLAPAGCGGADPQRPPNVVLFVADTLRSDALGCYGNEVVETPAVDSLAREGMLFRNAYAQSSWTRASVASMLTGLYPEAHRVLGRDSIADPRLSLLPEPLAARGYATAAIVTNPNVGSFFGFDQGFDDFDELYRRRRHGIVESRELITPSDEVVERALAWIAEAPRPFFLFVLTIDPHWPYDPPAHFDRYGGDYEGPFDEGGGSSNARAISRADRERVRSFYHGEVAFNDESFGRLLAGLREADLYDDTAVIFTSDHGEEFWEHDGRWHGTKLFEESIRVPLLIRYPPRVPQGRVVERVVETVDIPPTVLDLAGAEAPEPLDGRSLLAGGDAETDDETAYASLDLDGHEVKALVAPPWKLIWYPDRDHRVLYDLESDAAERIDLHRPGDARSDAILARLLARSRASEARGEQLGDTPRADPATLPEEERDALEALGYIDGQEP